MTRIFTTHSSLDNERAIEVRDWLVANVGWPVPGPRSGSWACAGGAAAERPDKRDAEPRAASSVAGHPRGPCVVAERSPPPPTRGGPCRI